MSVTIKQIAKLAGVAPTTVSLVMKDSKKVGEDTKERVRRIMRENDYFPNQSGRLLKQGRTDTIAVLTTYFHGIFKMEFMNGVENAAYNSKYKLGHYFAGAGEVSQKCKEILLGRMADCLIILAEKIEPELIEKLRGQGKHVVLVEDTCEGYPGITFDNKKASNEALYYLSSTGRRKIALTIADLAKYGKYDFVKGRVEGYKETLSELGLSYSRLYEIPSYSFEHGESVYDMYASDTEKPDAIFFASGDLTAAAFMKKAVLNGVKIPSDLAVMGFDDSVIAPVTTPALTSVKQPAHEIGKAAFEMASALLNGDKESLGKIIRVAPAITIRESA